MSIKLNRVFTTKSAFGNLKIGEFFVCEDALGTLCIKTDKDAFIRIGMSVVIEGCATLYVYEAEVEINWSLK